MKRKQLTPAQFTIWLGETFTARTLARAADISQAAAYRLLRGETMPKASTLAALNVDILYVPR